MEQYKVRLSVQANKDLRGIAFYIATRLYAPATASKTLKNIKNEVYERLSSTPYFPLVDNKRLAALGLRRMNVKKYAVFFIIFEKENAVDVERVIHGSRDWERILLEDAR